MNASSSLFLACGPSSMSFFIVILLFTLLPMLPGVILGGVALAMKRASNRHARTWGQIALFTFLPGLFLTLNFWFGWIELPWR